MSSGQSFDHTASSDVIPIVCGDGARAELHLNGAHVTSWVPAGAREDRLFVSSKSAFGAGASIRGGIPVIFPQFASEGPLPKHGFARTSPWSVVAIDENADFARVELEMSDSDITRAIWPVAFHATLAVRIEDATLDVTLNISSRHDAAFSFTAALHTYFRVRDAHLTHVLGLSGLRYRDALEGRAEHEETAPELSIGGEIDRVYYDATSPLELREPDRALRIQQRGLRDVVVWNPGESGLRGKSDFVSGEEREMLCIEAAVVQHPIVLAPGEQWSGAQVVRVIR